ncbi:MAG: acyl-CoA-binding protein, partial [Pseudomonadales bacterium]|nr:acyl-CoA-binding protein [Pseudomonadales bacterium]
MTAALTINQKTTKPEVHDDLIALYEDACEKRNVVVGYLSMEEIQDAYGLYKQSSFGDAPNASGELNDFQQKKREAWVQFVGVSAEEAKKKYIAIVTSGLKKRDKAQAGKADREKALQRLGSAGKVSQQSVEEIRSIAYLGLGDNYLEMGDWKHLGPELYLEEFGEIQFNERSKITLPTASYEDYEKLQQAYEKSLPYFLARANENFTPKSMLTAKGTATLGAQAKMFFRIDNDKPLDCYLKHSNTTSSNGEFESSLDDRNVSTYRASLKLQMPGGGEFDLPMVSGRTFFPDYENFFSFLTARKPIYEIIKDNPFAFYTAIETQRMAPSSYTGVIYHSAIPMKSQTPVGCLYFKFRLLRDGLSVEEGLLDEETQRKLLKTTNIRKEGSTAPFYLLDEYQLRLSESDGISYKFQAQIYNPALDGADERVRLNPAIPWSESEFPWFDMATIDITSILPEQSQHEIVMSPVSLSQSRLFAAPEPGSIYDYSAHSWVRNRMYPYFRLAKFGQTLQIEGSKGDSVNVLFFAGFDALEGFDNTSIQLILHSDKNTSYTLNIETPLQQSVQIEGEYVFRILLPNHVCIEVIDVIFEQKKSLAFTKIKLVNAVRQQVFSCLATEENNKHFFVDSRGLPVGSSTFQCKGLLDQSLKEKQKLFNWPIAKGELPLFGVFESFSQIPGWDQYAVRNQVYINTKQLDEFRSDKSEEKGLKLKRFSDYRQLVESRFGDQLVPNEIVKNWQSDSQFARQYIAGAHPCMIDLCKSVPSSFPDDALDEILAGGKEGLFRAIEQRRVFVVDVDVLVGLKRNLPAPIVLFYREGDDSLTPIAIQLDQENRGLV